MGESLYHLLGVDRDADEATIRRAYREHVKVTHPDVSDDPDATVTFMRLSTARDVLTDEHQRARYDRLGHEAYVAAELKSELWATSADRPDNDGPRSTDESRTSRPRGATRGTSRNTTTDAVHSRVAGGCATTAAASSNHAASTGHRYRPPSVGTKTATPIDRLGGSVRSLGPWLVVHVVFLVTAAGAAGMLVASTGSVPALSLPLGTGFFGLALFLSALHVVSILYV